MKKLFLSIIIAVSGLATQTANAQIGISINIGSPVRVHRPVAPAVVYDDFYYLPEVEAYYSVPEHCYYYMDGNRWVNAAYLPGRYRNYDWRYARRYEVKTQRPFENHNYYRNRFGGNAGRDWNRNWNNDQYANRGNNRNDNRYDGRRPDSPYDSNNSGRGGYNQPDRRNDDRNNGWNNQPGRGNSNNWNNNRNDDRNNGDNNRGYGPDRNQGGYLNNNSNRGNQRDNDNRGSNNGNGQRLVGNSRNSRPDFGSVKRVAF